jgi:hypothetical protein
MFAAISRPRRSVDPSKKRSPQLFSDAAVVSLAERSIGWATGGLAIYVSQRTGLPVRIYRVDPLTGKREMVREFTPSNPLGAYSVRALMHSEDGPGCSGFSGSPPSRFWRKG